MKAPVTVANPTLSASETFGGIINPVLVPIPAFAKSTDDCGIVVPTETCVPEIPPYTSRTNSSPTIFVPIPTRLTSSIKNCPSPGLTANGICEGTVIPVPTIACYSTNAVLPIETSLNVDIPEDTTSPVTLPNKLVFIEDTFNDDMVKFPLIKTSLLKKASSLNVDIP